MHFLYQIVTSVFVYTLYEEDNYPILHMTNLFTEESKDFTRVSEILEIMTFDPEISPEDYETIEDLISSCRHC